MSHPLFENSLSSGNCYSVADLLSLQTTDREIWEAASRVPFHHAKKRQLSREKFDTNPPPSLPSLPFLTYPVLYGYLPTGGYPPPSENGIPLRCKSSRIYSWLYLPLLFLSPNTAMIINPISHLRLPVRSPPPRIGMNKFLFCI
ncbi:Uncharacterised protein [Bacteroides xylanisolvens]|nr:Uncharacterised protein [Bacteroides xylanisolvens]